MQCAAVKILSLVMMEPPQMNKSRCVLLISKFNHSSTIRKFIHIPNQFVKYISEKPIVSNQLRCSDDKLQLPAQAALI